MIQHIEKTKCETNMNGGTAFTIQANAKMFKILSSGLYSNKERAIIREVSCNAYDANVDAGNGHIPIEVHLPNTLEPYFSIKDAGTGLNPEQMVNIYTQYGNSTKTDRNDQIGALGLGSKSPFSYIDSFTVISITEGEKNTYSCYIDGNGEPQLQPFGTETTDERNGVEVTFPVKTEDFGKFRSEAEVVYRPFDVKPDVVGNSSYEVKAFSVLLTSDDTEAPEWQLVKPEGSYYNRDSIRVAVQGNIEYPISVHQIESQLTDHARQLVRENFRLHFAIGELDIAASREELGYDKLTIDNIVKKFETMAQEIGDVQNATVNAFETKYEAMQYISTIKDTTNIYNKYDFTWNGEKISNQIKVENNSEVIKYVRNNRGTISRKSLVDTYYGYYHLTIPKTDNNTIWIYNDDGKKSNNVTKSRSQVTHGNQVYLVNDIAFFDIIGNPEYVKASDIDMPTRNTTKSVYGAGRFFKKYSHTRYTGSQFSGSFMNADYVGLDIEDEFYYVELKGSNMVEYYNMYEIIQVAKNLNLIDEDIEIIGVSTGHANTKKFQKYGGIEFTEFIKNKVKKSRKFKTELKKVADLKTKQRITSMGGVFYELLTNDTFIAELADDSEFAKVKTVLDAIDVDQRLVELVKSVAYDLDLTIPDSDFSGHVALEEAYPLISECNWNTNKSFIRDYIKGMDMLGKLREQELVANETSETKEEEAI